MSENRSPLPPPSRMVRNFLEYKESDYADLERDLPTCSDESGWPRDPFMESYFFFYGTLMDPSTLARALQLSEPPKMRPARVLGYETKLWGQYPALVHGKTLHPVDGVACEILFGEHWDQLFAYETDRYALQPILIDLLDTGEEAVEGYAFMWNGDPEELRSGSLEER